jgi:hypothetical protein
MKKYSALILLPCAFALLTAERVEAAPVEWDFIATGCTSLYGGGCVSGQHYPVTLATLTLPGLDSSGSATFNGGHGPAIYTGDSFVLDFSSSYHPLTSAFTQNPTPFGECAFREVCQFDLSWSEVAGQLEALRLHVNAFNDTLGGSIGPGYAFGLGGGEIASDNIYFGAGGMFAGCSLFPCQISGYWVNDALVTAPEPGTLALLASAFGVWGLAGRRTNRSGRNPHTAILCRIGFFPGMARGRGVTEFADAGARRGAFG